MEIKSINPSLGYNYTNQKKQNINFKAIKTFDAITGTSLNMFLGLNLTGYGRTLNFLIKRLFGIQQGLEFIETAKSNKILADLILELELPQHGSCFSTKEIDELVALRDESKQLEAIKQKLRNAKTITKEMIQSMEQI